MKMPSIRHSVVESKPYKPDFVPWHPIGNRLIKFIYGLNFNDNENRVPAVVDAFADLSLAMSGNIEQRILMLRI